MENSATKTYIHTANEFEAIERILLYFKVSNSYINEDIIKSIEKLNNFNNQSEVPFELSSDKQKEFLEIKYYEKTLSTMMYVRTIDNFINYFKEVLSEIVSKKPQILKSNEMESLDFILSYKNYEELINALSEKKIESLFYSGISDIQKYFQKKLGIELFKENFEQINLLVKQRNLAVHNRSRISKEFIKQFPKENFKEDMYLDFTFEYVGKVVLALYKIINELDYKLSDKFKLTLIQF